MKPILLRLKKPLLFVGMALMVSALFLPMGWSGRRPLHPDVSHPYAINNHGVMFVSAADMNWQLGLALAGFLFVIAGIAIGLITKSTIP